MIVEFYGVWICELFCVQDEVVCGYGCFFEVEWYVEFGICELFEEDVVVVVWIGGSFCLEVILIWDCLYGWDYGVVVCDEGECICVVVVELVVVVVVGVFVVVELIELVGCWVELEVVVLCVGIGVVVYVGGEFVDYVGDLMIFD